MFLPDRFDGAAYDCFIIGSGPAGLTAALALGEAGRRVLVFESGDADVPRNELSNSVGYGHYSGAYWNLHWIRALGGTSVLIVTGVALDTFRQMESQMTIRRHEGFLKS